MKRPRARRITPLRALRLGGATGVAPGARAGFHADAAVRAFPGRLQAEAGDARARLLASALSLLIHGALIFALALAAAFAPEPLIEEFIEVTRLSESESEEAAAPRPRAIAERRSALYAPARATARPPILNPVVVQPRSSVVATEVFKSGIINPLASPAPRERTEVEVEQVRAYQSPIVATSQKLDDVVVKNLAEPVLEGPVNADPPGLASGPRRAQGSAGPGGSGGSALGTGSSVREGLASNRDVFGASSGERAQVGLEYGAGGGRGSGGDGLGAGGGGACLDRPEVQRYLEQVKDSVYQRWKSASLRGAHQSTIRVRIDPGGGTSQVRVIEASSEGIGLSAMRALQAASPFATMPDRVRCLANRDLRLLFDLETQ